MPRVKLNPCRWCMKYGRLASGWEQFSGYRNHGWMPLCTRCANRRLNNPWNALLPMRRVGGHQHPGGCPETDCRTCAELATAAGRCP